MLTSRSPCEYVLALRKQKTKGQKLVFRIFLRCLHHPELIIDHIHNNRHVGFDIIMQISHVVCQGANIIMMLFLRKSAGLNSEVSSPKSHLRAKM